MTDLVRTLSTEQKQAAWRKRFAAENPGVQIQTGGDPVDRHVESGSSDASPRLSSTEATPRGGSGATRRPKRAKTTRKDRRQHDGRWQVRVGKEWENDPFNCTDGGSTPHYRRRRNGQFVKRDKCEGNVAHVGTVEINSKPFIHSAPLTRAQLRSEKPIDGHVLYEFTSFGDGKRDSEW